MTKPARPQPTPPAKHLDSMVAPSMDMLFGNDGNVAPCMNKVGGSTRHLALLVVVLFILGGTF